MSSKINFLTSNVLPNQIAVQQWLSKHGISYSLAQKYQEGGWLKKLGSGVYYRPDPDPNKKPDWIEAFLAVRKQLELPVHVAGLTSLNHQGLGHYLNLSDEQVWLGVVDKQSLPKWFREFPEQQWIYCSNSKLENTDDKYLTTISIAGRELVASSQELAAYEVVNAIGKEISFEHLSELFQGLTNLSPRKVQGLLSRSRDVRTNRIFLFLAHYHGHQWINRVDESAIQLGSGNRQVVKNGYYDSRYKITVPASLKLKKESS